MRRIPIEHYDKKTYVNIDDISKEAIIVVNWGHNKKAVLVATAFDPHSEQDPDAYGFAWTYLTELTYVPKYAKKFLTITNAIKAAWRGGGKVEVLDSEADLADWLKNA